MLFGSGTSSGRLYCENKVGGAYSVVTTCPVRDCEHLNSQEVGNSEAAYVLTLTVSRLTVLLIWRDGPQHGKPVTR